MSNNKKIFTEKFKLPFSVQKHCIFISYTTTVFGFSSCMKVSVKTSIKPKRKLSRETCLGSANVVDVLYMLHVCTSYREPLVTMLNTIKMTF